jgi:5-methylcytosine-specific restriction endonuclease McrA
MEAQANMTFEEYLNTIDGSLSEVKRKILAELWSKGDAFPRDWVASSLLLEVTQQKYFDRRSRELRDGNGCDIETKHVNGEHHYRLVSESLASANPRSYLTEKQKKDLFRHAGNLCQVCGVRMVAGVRGLQADHKIPLIRGGSHMPENWQPICNECNVAKRRACQGCSDDCKTCQWAFPEHTGFPIITRVPKKLFDEVQELQRKNPKWLEKLISDYIDRGEK